MSDFFQRHPRFFDTGETNPDPNRLIGRYGAIIEPRRDIFAGARVLDLGSHDGRWSLAALDAGAAHVTGVEARANLIEKAEASFSHYGVETGRYVFEVNDANTYLRDADADSVDVVLCLGFFYHTAHHMELIAQFARLGARHIVIDTAVTQDDRPIILMNTEETGDSRRSIDYMATGRAAVPVGRPSPAALVMMLDGAGYETAFYPWPEYAGDWAALPDYRKGDRMTAIAARRGERGG